MQKIKNFLFKNTSTKQTVTKNAFWLFLGEIIGRIFKLMIVIFATRKLGVENWGLFSYALSFVSFFYIFGDFGINTLITREMSKENTDKYLYLSTSFIIKITILIIMLFLSILLTPKLGNIRLSLNIVTVISILLFSDAMRDFALSINRSLQKMEREAYSKIITNLIIMVLGIVLITKKADPLSLAIAYATGSIISSIFMFWSIKNELKKIKIKIYKESLKNIYDFSWPFMVTSFFSFLFSLDSIMLGQMKSVADVGLYSAASRLVLFTTIIPAFFAISIFPILSKYEKDIKKTSHIFEKTMEVIFTISIPLTVGCFLLSQKIILFVFGSNYITGAATFGILSISILASFPNIILDNYLYSKNLQKKFITTTLLGVIFNIILNILLIPKFGALGAAISTTTAQILIMTINWNLLKKFMTFSVLPKIKNIILINIIFMIIILILKYTNINLILIIIISLLSYFILLRISKENILSEVIEIIKK